MKPDSSPARRPRSAEGPAWKQIVSRFQTPSVNRGVWQLLNTLVPYIGLWYLMSLSLRVSWWLALPLAVLAGGFLVRIFIIFHDCGHGSFFKSRRANHLLGAITGVLAFTPFHHWRWEHAIHHGTSGDLDRRGTGDVWTLTVQEYLEASRARRLAYRFARHPLVLFLLAPVFLFVVKHRIPSRGAPVRERYSVHWTNLGIGVMAAILIAWLGLKAYLILQLTVVITAGTAGVWLFYVQHQFEGVYWERGETWDATDAALRGSSFYKLPKVLQWFSGNIGFHHIHHLSPRIPNYHLETCHRADDLFQAVTPITLRASLKSFTFRLWDEHQRKLVSFRQVRHRRRGSPSPSNVAA